MKNWLPGPVQIAPEVRAAFASEPFNHRTPEFAALADQVKGRLWKLTRANHIALMMGSGTLANDAIAAHLVGRGLILTNGEFGERLVTHAASAGLEFDVSRADWGSPLEYAITRRPGWIWAVHCETSTGVVNDIDRLRNVARAEGARLILDCVSSLGAVPFTLDGVYLASGVSGKALGSLSGVAVVFGQEAVSAPVAPYLDLWAHWADVPHTFNSALLAALSEALNAEHPAYPQDIRDRLADAGFNLIGDGSAPHVITVALTDSEAFARRMAGRGHLLSWQSEYLRRRNWAQVCFMGAFRTEDIEGLIETMIEVGPC